MTSGRSLEFVIDGDRYGHIGRRIEATKVGCAKHDVYWPASVAVSEVVGGELLVVHWHAIRNAVPAHMSC